LVSPEVAAITAIRGILTDPRNLREAPEIVLSDEFDIDDTMIIKPSSEPEKVKVIRGPNIKPLPIMKSLLQDVTGEVLLKVGDNITTDHIMPAGAKILPLRSNIPAISEHVFERVDPAFAKRAEEKGGGMIVGGENYGQGSSREHAALAPRYLGVKAVIAKSFARIHKANLVNFGILPLEFEEPEDYYEVEQGDIVEMPGVRSLLEKGGTGVLAEVVTKGLKISLRCDLTPRFRKIVVAGGLMNFTKNKLTQSS